MKTGKLSLARVKICGSVDVCPLTLEMDPFHTMLLCPNHSHSFLPRYHSLLNQTLNCFSHPRNGMGRGCNYRDGLCSDLSPFNKSDNILMVSGEDALMLSMRDFFTLFASAGGMGKLNKSTTSTFSPFATLIRVSMDQFFCPLSIDPMWVQCSSDSYPSCSWDNPFSFLN
jgi:hypothetical protein